MASQDARTVTMTVGNTNSVTAESYGDNGGQLNTPATETAQGPLTDRPAALIISNTIGWSVSGGLPSALRLLISLLHCLGLVVYCTVFRMTGHDQNFCHKVGLRVVKPDPPPHLRREHPTLSWLYNPTFFYESLLRLENVKLVFGFGMVTSDPALKIKNLLFSSAAFCLVNSFSFDTPLTTIGYTQEEFDFWKELHFKVSKFSSAVFSLGSDLFQHFCLQYQIAEFNINHSRLLLTPDEENFGRTAPTLIPTSGQFQILTLVDEHDIPFLTSDSIIGKAMHSTAENFVSMGKDPPKWKILGVKKGQEDDIITRLNPHPRLKIIFQPFPPADIDRELMTSQLVLVLPSSLDSEDLTLNAMTLRIPVVVPKGSSAHIPVRQYLPMYADHIAVDMHTGFEELKMTIIRAVNNYKICLKRAVAVREALKPIVAKVREIMKQMFIEVLEQHSDLTEDDLTALSRNSIQDIAAGVPMEDVESGGVGEEVAVPTESNNPGQDNQGERSIRSHNPVATSTTRDYNTSSRQPSQEGVQLEDEEGGVGDELAVPTESNNPGQDNQDLQMEDVESGGVGEEVAVPTESKNPRQDNQGERSIRSHNAVATSTTSCNNPSSRHPSEESVHLEDEEDGVGDELAVPAESNNPGQDNQGEQPMRSHNPVATPTTSSHNPSSRKPSQDSLGVRVQVKDGIPEGDKHMDDVQRDLFSHERTAENSETFMRRLTYIHPDVQGEDVSEGSIIFRLKCGSIEAAKAVWSAYGNGRLDETADETFLSLELMDDIGARCLWMETLIGYAEYSSCIKFLADKEYSMSLHEQKHLAEKKRTIGTLQRERTRAMSEKAMVATKNDSLAAQVTENVHTRDGLLLENERESQLKEKDEGALFMEYLEMKNVARQYRARRKEQDRLINWQTSRLAALKEIYSTQCGEINELEDAMARLYKGIPPKGSVRKLPRHEKHGQFYDLRGLIINQKGHLVISDWGAYGQPGSVKTITPATNQTLSIIIFFCLKEPFKPRGVAIDHKGIMYIADYDNHCILVCDSRSKLIKVLAVDKLKGPLGVFVDKSGNVFIPDYKANCVIKCTGDGNIISSKNLTQPYSLTMDSSGQLLVSCLHEHCIYVLDGDLQVLYSFGHDDLEYPRGISVDQNDIIYVSDLDVVRKYNSRGEFLSNAAEDVYPRQIAVFADGTIVYTDRRDHFIYIIHV